MANEENTVRSPDLRARRARAVGLTLLLPNRFEPRQVEKLDHFDRLAVS